MKEQSLPSFYSRVLFDLSERKKNREKYLFDLKEALAIFEQNAILTNVLSSPFVTRGQKKGILERLFRGKLEEDLLSLLEKLCDKNRLSLLPKILELFSKRIQKESGVLGVELIVPDHLDETNRCALEEKLAAAYGKKVELREKIDRRLIGGMILLFPNNQMLDYSIKTRLCKLQQSFR